MNTKRVLVTGGGGYIGKILINHLLKKGFSVTTLIRNKANIPSNQNSKLTVIIGDLSDRKVLEKAIKDVNIIFHLAAALNIFEHNNLLYRANIIGLKNLLKVCQKSKDPIGFIFTSSVDVLIKKSDYAKSKLRGEEIVKEISKNKNIKYAIARVGNVYNVEDNSGIGPGIIDIIIKNNWKSSIIYHCLGSKIIYPIEMKTLIKKLTDLSSRINNQTVNIFNSPVSIKQIITNAKKKNIIDTIPSKLIFGRSILYLWLTIAKFFKRGDLLVYLSLSK
jgi:nucleoside-diphosphate-sugar epimerase